MGGGKYCKVCNISLTAFRSLEKRIKDGSCILPDGLSRCLRDFYKNLNWSNFLKDMKENPRPWTLIHGDFHPGNVIWLPKDPICPVKIIDWEFAKVGCGPAELAMFTWGVYDFAKHDMHTLVDLVRIYYDALVKINPSIGSVYGQEDCLDDFAVCGMRSWMLRFPALMSTLPTWTDHFSRQLETFRSMFGPPSHKISFPNI